MKELIPQSQLYPADHGLRGTYYSGTNLANSFAVWVRVDDSVNFAWGTNSPEPTILSLPFSVRWAGKVKANAAGSYQFFTSSDDGVRLYVNGQLLINNWAPHALTEDSAAINLPAAGQFYDLTMEYFNAAGPGTAVLSWKPPNELKQVIPSDNLTPHQNNSPPALSPIPNMIAERNSLVTFTASATDADGAAQSLIYSLDPGAPAGATINSSNGVFTWTPSSAQPGGSYNITLRVTDTGWPMMSDAEPFTITLPFLPADLAVASSAVFQSTNLQVTLTLTNLGPDTAQNIVLTNIVPAGASVISVFCEAGSCLSTNGSVICAFPSFPANASAVVTLTFRVEPQNFFTNVCSVGSSNLDPNAANNVSAIVVPMGGSQDFDNDGIPDVWELANGTNPRVADAGEDPDGDGLTNMQEYIAGTDPHDPASVLRITMISMEEGINLTTISFVAVSNHSYTILSSTNLAATSWEQLTNLSAFATGILTVTNLTRADTMRFYRILTKP